MMIMLKIKIFNNYFKQQKQYIKKVFKLGKS
jgi:hypothetical protein